MSVAYVEQSKRERRSTSYLWEPYFPCGRVVLLQGEGGIGKSTFLYYLVGAWSKGVDLSGNSIDRPLRIIYQNCEDDMDEDLLPSLDEVSADFDNIFFIDETKENVKMGNPVIEQAIIEKNADVFIMDSIEHYIGNSTDTNNAVECTNKIQSLVDISRKTGCTFILVGHLNKNTGMKATHRGLGSVAIFNTVRCVLMMARNPKQPEVNVIMHVKSNGRNRRGCPIAYSLNDIKDESNRLIRREFCYLGECSITEEELFASQNPSAKKIQRAIDLFIKLLGDGVRLPSKEVYAAGKEQGISDRTMDSARAKLPIQTEKGKGGRQYIWMDQKIDGKEDDN